VVRVCVCAGGAYTRTHTHTHDCHASPIAQLDGHRIEHGVPVNELDHMTIRMTVRPPGNVYQQDWVEHLRLAA
jgi:hypothetical protein